MKHFDRGMTPQKKTKQRVKAKQIITILKESVISRKEKLQGALKGVYLLTKHGLKKMVDPKDHASSNYKAVRNANKKERDQGNPVFWKRRKK